MGIQFDQPLWLIVLLPAAAYLIWSWRRGAASASPLMRPALLIRSLIIVLLVCSIAGLQAFTYVQYLSVVYVIDRSDSMKELPKEYSEWVKRSAGAKAAKDELAVVSAGAGSAVERSMSQEELASLSFHAALNTAYTDLDSALQLASGLTRGKASPRVVLVSDGRENAGEVLKQGRLLGYQGIPVDVLVVPSKEERDVAVEGLKLPSRLYEAEAYSMEIQINSTFAGSGELRLYEDNTEISRQTVSVERGENHFAVQSTALGPGLHRYRAEVYFAEDERSMNNAAYAFSEVGGPPAVLVVEASPGSASNLTAMLSASQIRYEVIAPEQLSVELADYRRYESIILDNVPATRISTYKMEQIETAVRDLGIGLIMTGGDSSFGVGGYFKTPIEKALPVKMELEGERELPSLALMLVIDRSGSMRGAKMELAKQAAMQTVEMLRDQDTVGVITFDSVPWTVVEPTQLFNREDVLQAIGSITWEGGTDIYPAVSEGYNKILNIEAQRKHMILLSDGESSTNNDYGALTTAMGANNITMSTVAVGTDSDTRLLESLAQMAGGRYYFAYDQTTIPAIFSREAVLASRTYVIDEPFIPGIYQPGDWAALLSGGLPQIHAYVAATTKPTAESVLVSPESDPLLARWQYGAGRAATWTSDTAGRWSADWVRWERFPEIFSHVVKWTFPQYQQTPFELTANPEGGKARLSIRSSDASLEGDVLASVISDDLNSQSITAVQTGPGQYEAAIDGVKPGVYLTKLEVRKDSEAAGGAAGEVPGIVTTGFVVPYSPEYRIESEDGTAKLKQLAEASGGRMLSLERPEEVFQGELEPERRRESLTRELLIAALLLWVIDIAIRRLASAGLFAYWPRRRRGGDAATLPHSTMSIPAQGAAPSKGSRAQQEKAGTGDTPLPPADTPQEAATQPDVMSRLLEAKKRRGL